MYYYNAKNSFCCESLYSSNSLLKRKSTECKLRDFEFLNYRMTIVVN